MTFENNTIEGVKAEWNDAINYINRINQCFINCNVASSMLHALNWYHSLLCLYRELSPYIKDKGKIEAVFDTISNELPQTRVGIINHDIYKKLQDLEITLRGIYKSSGLQMKESRDPRLT